jgi:hypothetical protein
MIAAIIPTTYPYDDSSRCVAYIKVANPHKRAIITDPIYRIDLSMESEKKKSRLSFNNEIIYCQR